MALTADEIGQYLEAVRLGLDKWDLFLNLGLAHFAQTEFLKASDALQFAVLLGQSHLGAHFNLAVAFERQNRLPEALQEIMVSSVLAPKDRVVGNMNAIICIELGNLVCAHDESAHLVQASLSYLAARINLAHLTSLRPRLFASI